MKNKNKVSSNEEWHQAFKALELAMDGEDIKRNLNKVIKVMAGFTESEDIQIYKYNKDTKRVSNYLSLKDKSGNNNSIIRNYILHGNYDGFIGDDKDIKITINEVDTKYDKYVILVKNKNDLNDQLNRMHIKVIRRVFKLLLEKLEERENLRRAYLTDVDTGLGNRAYYTETARKMVARNEEITYAIVDLFRLKYINDNFSHVKGDEYIKTAANILKEQFPQDKQLFRIGGDEFAVLSFRMSKEKMRRLLRQADLKLSKETLGLELETPLHLNYGVVREKGDIDKLSYDAEQELHQSKGKLYSKYKVNRRT